MMPETTVLFYRERQEVPALDWIIAQPRDARVRLAARVDLLKNQGHGLRRPYADFLRDGIWELRVRVGRVNYRLLYFFHGQGVVLLAHGITKQQDVPGIEIQRAIERKARFEKDPGNHCAEVEL
jgi:hypothetical protein